MNSTNLAFFPLVPKGKTPAIQEWQKVKPGAYPPYSNHGLALTDEDLVLDADPRNYPEGRDVLQELLDLHRVPQTRIVKTARGGYHFYFRKPPSLKVRKKQELFPGIDFLSEGAYTVQPGSVTGDGDYKLVIDAPIADLPPSLMAVLEQPSEAASDGGDASLINFDQYKSECEVFQVAVEGENGDHATFVMACRGRDLGLPSEIVFQLMRDYWNIRCLPPWEDAELWQKVQNAYRYAKNRAGSQTPEAKFGSELDLTSSVSFENGNAVVPMYPKPEKVSQSKKLLDCAAGIHELWHDSSKQAYATISINGHFEHHPIRSAGFKDWLLHRYYNVFKGAPSNQAYEDALKLLETRARFDGLCHIANFRVAEHEGSVYVDLTNENWEVVEINRDSWKIIQNSPVKFIRFDKTLALPRPEPGSLEALAKWKAMFKLSEQDWILVLGYLVTCFKPASSPYPVLFLIAEQGAGKSNFTKMIRALIDPCVAPTRNKPKDEQDLLIGAKRVHIVAFDNLSSINQEFSDQICRLATGGGNSFRTLYKDDEETSFDFRKPVIINGIGDLANQGDLLDRSVLVNLSPLAGTEVKPETELWTEFESLRPSILGLIFDAVSRALACRGETRKSLKELPRMADFAVWAAASEQSFGLQSGAFLTAYAANRRDASEVVLDASPLAQIIQGDLKLPFEGIATELFKHVRLFAGRDRVIATSPKNLANSLRRISPALRRAGITVEFFRTTRAGKTERLIRVQRAYQPMFKGLI